MSREQLTEACEKGDLDGVKKILLDPECNVYVPDNKKQIPIFVAASNGKLEILKYFYKLNDKSLNSEKKATLNGKAFIMCFDYSKGKGRLSGNFYSFMFKFFDFISKNRNKKEKKNLHGNEDFYFDIDLNASDDEGNTLVHLISTAENQFPSNYSNVLKYVLQSKTEYGDIDPDALNKSGYTALAEVIKVGNYFSERAEHLILAGADIFKKDNVNSDSHSPIELLLESEHADFKEKILGFIVNKIILQRLAECQSETKPMDVTEKLHHVRVRFKLNDGEDLYEKFKELKGKGYEAKCYNDVLSDLDKLIREIKKCLIDLGQNKTTHDPVIAYLYKRHEEIQGKMKELNVFEPKIIESKTTTLTNTTDLKESFFGQILSFFKKKPTGDRQEENKEFMNHNL